MIVCIETHKQQLRFSVRGVGDNIGLEHLDFGIIDLEYPESTQMLGFLVVLSNILTVGAIRVKLVSSLERVNWKQAGLVIWSNKFDSQYWIGTRNYGFTLEPPVPQKDCD